MHFIRKLNLQADQFVFCCFWSKLFTEKKGKKKFGSESCFWQLHVTSPLLKGTLMLNPLFYYNHNLILKFKIVLPELFVAKYRESVTKFIGTTFVTGRCLKTPILTEITDCVSLHVKKYLL